MRPSRRDVLSALPALPIAVLGAAHAADVSRNASLLKCEMFCDDTVRLDGDFSFVPALEALQPCLVYVPLSFGYRGFRLLVDDGKSKTEPPFHPPSDPPYFGMLKDPTNYLRMVRGQIVGFRTTVPAKSVFPSAGRFGLILQYVPEPMRSFTDIPGVVVVEDGDVVMPPRSVTVV
ncbi:MAG TPA: hypothetical protein VGF56_01800 [Rhizomicrobium sp.]|jgi:hypothetical protein